MKEEYVLLKELTDLPGIPGQEQQVRKYLEKKCAQYTSDIKFDGLGGIMATLTGDSKGPRILVGGHMDEVGFMITGIKEDGFLLFSPMGGWNAQVLSSQQVTIMSKFGPVLGVIGSKPPHLMSKEEREQVLKIDKMFIDCGAKSAQEIGQMGIELGDMVVPYIEFRALGIDQKHLLAKAWDNRIGCCVMLEILKNLKAQKSPNIYIGAGTVQEEVGCRGAMTVGYMANADICFSVDVGIANDVYGSTDKEGMEFEKGPQIHLFDYGTIGHRALREFVVGIAKELNIPYQLATLKGGGTDASAFHVSKNGAPSLSIGIPSRYIHSHTSMIHYDDYINTVKLLTEVILRLNSETVDKIRQA